MTDQTHYQPGDLFASDFYYNQQPCVDLRLCITCEDRIEQFIFVRIGAQQKQLMFVITNNLHQCMGDLIRRATDE